MPKNGQIITFSVVPTGSYLSAGEAYRVDMPKGAREFRFVSIARGSSAYAKPYTVANAQWQVA